MELSWPEVTSEPQVSQKTDTSVAQIRATVDKVERHVPWTKTTSAQEVAKQQEIDPDIATVYKAMKANTKPGKSQMESESPAARHNVMIWYSLILYDGVLCKKNGTNVYIQLIVPSLMKKQVQTKHRILQGYYWYQLKALCHGL
jgi:hypothetical protein